MSLYSSIWPFQTIVWQVKRAYLRNQYVYHEQDISHLADRNTAVHLHLEHLRKVSSLTTHILATDTDIIIQIPAVFVKVTKAKSREKRENLYQSSTQILFCAWNKYAPHRLAPSFSPSTIGMKGAVENVKKRREHLQEERRALGRSIHQMSYTTRKDTVRLCLWEKLFCGQV